MKSGQKIDLGLTGYDELFMTDQERAENKLPRIYDIPLSEIDPFPDHPFQVRMDEDMQLLVESIKERGLITIVEAPPAPLWQTVIMMKDATNSLKEISDRCFLSGKVDEDMLLNTIEDLQTCIEDVTNLCFPEENNENRPYRAVSDRER